MQVVHARESYDEPCCCRCRRPRVVSRCVPTLMSLCVFRHTAVGDFKHCIVDLYVVMLELDSSTDTETETAGSACGGGSAGETRPPGPAGRRPKARRFLCPETTTLAPFPC